PVVVFLLLALTTMVRLIGLQRKGIRAMAVRSGDDAHAFLGRTFFGLVAAMLLFCVAYAINPGVTGVLGPLPWLMHDAIAWIGAVLAICGVILAGVAQFGMGKSWRIGMREGDRSELVSEGLYRLSRNPIYVGMMSSLAGIFLIAPNAV